MTRTSSTSQVQYASDDELREVLTQRLAVRGAATALASAAGVSQATISLMKSGRLRITPKVARQLGYERVSRWEPIATARNPRI
jgi:hypothetical protein